MSHAWLTIDIHTSYIIVTISQSTAVGLYEASIQVYIGESWLANIAGGGYICYETITIKCSVFKKC